MTQYALVRRGAQCGRTRFDTGNDASGLTDLTALDQDEVMPSTQLLKSNDTFQHRSRRYNSASEAP